MTKSPRFLDRHLAGEQVDIADFIDAWHDGEQPVQLHVYLGMTWPEYATWLSTCELPTAEAHAAARVDAVWTMGRGGQPLLVRVHSPIRCRPPCSIHWPTSHPLVGAAMRWDDQDGLIRRVCVHEIAHPDPDDQQVRLHPELLDHSCDSCCRATVVEGDFFVDDEPVEDVRRAFDNATDRGITGGPR